MATTDELITSLSESAAPVAPAPAPFKLFLRWMAVSLAFMAVMTSMLGLRQNLAERLHSPMFFTEVALLFIVVVTAGLSAAALSFPDMHNKRWLAGLPVPFLLLFWAVLGRAWLADNPPAPLPPHGMECLICITGLSFVPAVWMFYTLRKMASVHYCLSGALALIASSSLGCLALRLAEDTDSIRHLLLWHYLPMIGFGMIGLVLGRKFLKW